MLQILIIDTMTKIKLTLLFYNNYIKCYKIKIIGVNGDDTAINDNFIDFIRNLSSYSKKFVSILIKLSMNRKQKTIAKVISLFFPFIEINIRCSVLSYSSVCLSIY